MPDPGTSIPPEPRSSPAEAEPTLAHYFGGYAIIFLGAVGLALLLVLAMKLAR